MKFSDCDYDKIVDRKKKFGNLRMVLNEEESIHFINNVLVGDINRGKLDQARIQELNDSDLM